MASIAHFRDGLKQDFFKQLAVLGDFLSTQDIVAAATNTHYVWRNRVWNPMQTLWTFLIQILQPNAPCREAVAEVLAHDAVERDLAVPNAADPPKISPDPSAYCQARRRVPLQVFQVAFRHVGRRVQDKVQDHYLWHGRRIWIGDGSTLSMPDTPQLQKAFGQPSNQKPGCGFPVAKIVALFAWASGVVSEVAIGPWRQSELSLLYSIWGLLASGDILLADRFFCTYHMFGALLKRHCDGIFRLSGSRSRTLDFRTGQRLSRHERLVTWRRPRYSTVQISKRQWNSLPQELTVRLIRFHTRVPGFRSQTITLATTLLDPVVYPMKDLIALYADRWTVELRLRDLKTTMKMDVLRCKSVDMIRKEILVHLLAYNLIRALMWQASRAPCID